MSHTNHSMFSPCSFPNTKTHLRRMRAWLRSSALVWGFLGIALSIALLLPLWANPVPDCRAVKLSESLSWPTSAAWYQASSGPALLVADVSRDDGHLFSLSREGTVTLASGTAARHQRSGFVTFARAAGEEIFVEDEAGALIAFDRELRTERVVIDLAKIALDGGGRVADLLDWTPAPGGGVLGLVYVLDGDLTGLALAEIAEGGKARVVERLAVGEEAKTWFAQTAGNLTVVSGDGFFLNLAGGPSLERLNPGANNPIVLESSRKGAAGGPALQSSQAWREGQALKALLPGSGKRQAFIYFDLLEKSSVVSGVLGWEERLYVLSKEAISLAGKTRWTLVEVDPATGRDVQRFVLPTTAAHITVVPPSGVGIEWAILERSRVGRRALDGAPTFSSSRLLLISPSAITNPPTSWQDPRAAPRCGN